jgi:translation initiation factor IF-2
MMMKYRVHEVAKDFNVPSKEVIDLLSATFEGVYKHMTVLSEQDLNAVFEHYTKEKAVESFDAYFAYIHEIQIKPQPQNEIVEQVPQVQQNESTENKEEQKIIEKPKTETPSTEQNQTVEAVEQTESAKQAVPVRQLQTERPQQIRLNTNQPQPNRTQGGQPPQQGSPVVPRPQQFNQQNRPPQQQQNRPYNQNQNQNNRPSQPNQQFNKPTQAPQAGPRPHPNIQLPTKPGQQLPKNPTTIPQEKAKAIDRSVRYVDTKGSQVELEKYNEHYEQIAPVGISKDTLQTKQKIKQKTGDRRSPYSKRETENEKLKRLQLEKLRKPQLKITIPEEISVGELAARLKVAAKEVIKKLMLVGDGVMASISQNIDYETAALVAMELGAKVEKEIVITIEDKIIDASEDKDEHLKFRSPIVVVMGHVDHGKTSLLDAIRDTNVVAGEAGGITQHIGAYRVTTNGKEITFLDTPGHAAFTSMRARGAQVTDIAVLVVAADDGIMPQTIEAINHAKAANVAIIIAINKIDKPGANPEKVKQELTEYGLVPEEWGGETICVPVSAKLHQNIDGLLEMILLVAEMKDLKANPDRPAKGTVIEARLDKGRGPIATVLVQNGTLHPGDIIIAGTTVGRVRAMVNENGIRMEEAGPSVPVEITGLSEVPSAGDVFHAVSDERMARELVEQRRHLEKEEIFNLYQKVTLENLFEHMQKGEIKDLNLIIKADVQGSVEAVRQSLEKLSNDEVRVRIIHDGVGPISESDVMLAQASNAIIIGFNVRPDVSARNNAEQSGVEMRMYRIIYDCIEDISTAMKGMLAPKTREVQLGRAEVRLVYKITNVGTIAGCYVIEGKVARNALLRVVRGGIVITEDKIDSLKRFKDDAKEVAQGFECGIGLEKFNDIKEGDILESFIIEEYREN